MDTSDFTTTPPLKRCSKQDECVHPLGCWQPADSAHFTISLKCKDGLYHTCKACRKAYREQNRDRINAKNKEYYSRPEVKARSSQVSKEYRNKNADKIRERRHKQYLEHREKILDRNRSRKRNYDTPKVKADYHRRAAKKRSLPSNYTSRDWNVALSYFDHRCAVCGRPIGLWHTLAMDHWIPLSNSNCPGTIPTNIIPLCHGNDGCNNSKSTKDPLKWLVERFGKRKAARVMKRIQSYFDFLLGEPATVAIEDAPPANKTAVG